MKFREATEELLRSKLNSGIKYELWLFKPNPNPARGPAVPRAACALCASRALGLLRKSPAISTLMALVLFWGIYIRSALWGRPGHTVVSNGITGRAGSAQGEGMMQDRAVRGVQTAGNIVGFAVGLVGSRALSLLGQGSSVVCWPRVQGWGLLWKGPFRS